MLADGVRIKLEFRSRRPFRVNLGEKYHDCVSFQLKITETKNKILPALHTIQDGGCGQWAKVMESPGIDPGASRMLSERSTI